MKNRYRPQSGGGGGAEMAIPDFIRLAQREMTTAAEVGRKLCDLTEPSRCQESEVKAEGAVTGATMSVSDRCCDCGVQIMTGRNSTTDGVEYRELIPSQMWPVGRKKASLNNAVPV